MDFTQAHRAGGAHRLHTDTDAPSSKKSSGGAAALFAAASDAIAASQGVTA